MPSGDRGRTWFPEMIDHLRRYWRDDLSLDEVIALAQKLDDMVREIRTERDIKPPTYRCPGCGQRHYEGERRVSVRATILAAGRFGAAEETEMKRVERLWKKHRAAEGLDLYGRQESTDQTPRREVAEPGNASRPVACTAKPFSRTSAVAEAEVS